MPWFGLHRGPTRSRTAQYLNVTGALEGGSNWTTRITRPCAWPVLVPWIRTLETRVACFWNPSAYPCFRGIWIPAHGQRERLRCPWHQIRATPQNLSRTRRALPGDG